MNKCNSCFFKNPENYYICLINKSKLFDEADECPCKNCILKFICSTCCKPFLDHIHKGIINTIGHYTIIDYRIECLTIDPLTSRSNAMLIIQSLMYRFNPDLILSNETPYDIIQIEQRKQLENSFEKLVKNKKANFR